MSLGRCPKGFGKISILTRYRVATRSEVTHRNAQKETPVLPTSTPAAASRSVARRAVVSVVSTSLMTDATVAMGCRGNNSRRRSAPTDIPSCASGCERSAATSANSSRAEATASSAMVVTPSRRKSSHPSQSPSTRTARGRRAGREPRHSTPCDILRSGFCRRGDGSRASL